jgi:hypothetical protein
MTEIADALLAAIADLKATFERPLASVDDRLTALEATVGAVKAELVPMRAQVNGLANVDFGFLQAAAQRQLQDARAAREFQSRVDIKLDEIFGWGTVPPAFATSSVRNADVASRTFASGFLGQ